MGKRKPTEARKTRSAGAGKAKALKAPLPKTPKAAVAKAAAPAKRSSSKVSKPTAKPKASIPKSNGQAIHHAEAALVRTNLTAAELAEFRDMLLEKRRELIGDVHHLQNEAMRQGSSGESSGSSSMPIHMADIGTDTWEQELTLGLIENERGMLREIEDALHRIEEKTYGICMATNKPISKSRLRAKPWAKYCIEYARKRELGLV